ncbi:hypothetical protein [Methylomarinovum tepidoasis]|uniref:hypothetical protein n=1 Tax=Methylomarinovum tepidoasis TaxID=2840183 RepID=UPI002573B768|nr:hypothetical protein [Methylomarinovum sp. IN45]
MNAVVYRNRPDSLHELACRVREGGDFSIEFREFLDHWYGLSGDDARTAAIASEPEEIGEVEDTWLALRAGLRPPRWVNHPKRFLKRAYFAGGLESLKAVLLVESPTPFRRRQVFVSANALSRA